MFRDLGIAFAAALFAIFLLLMFQTGSKLLPIVIMLAIPLTLIGIMPGFWILNLNRAELIGGYANPVFFTATAMIGMIALAGIVVRNSVVLVDFIHYGIADGLVAGGSNRSQRRGSHAAHSVDRRNHVAGKLGDHAGPGFFRTGLGGHFWNS